MGVSMCLMTRGPAARVAALLELVRPAVDEIFVALDDRADDDVAAALAPVADVLVRYPYAEPVDRPLAWLHSRCSQEWVFTLDDDEIPSPALLDALPRLADARDVTHFFVPRRWLFPNAARWLDEPPWRPDYLLRLVRNDRRLLRFPDETHVPIAAIGPARYLELPVYHADCILNAREARERKARKYELLAPGKRAAGRPLNHAYYLPELAGRPRTRPLPDDDAAAVEYVLGARVSAVGPVPQLPHATRAEIDALWEGRELAESAYEARLRVLEPLDAVTAGEVRTVDVLVENLGDDVWPGGWDAKPKIRAVSRWTGDRSGSEPRTPLPGPLPPGTAAVVPVAVHAPAEPGRRTLELGLIHEDVRRFATVIAGDVEVRRRRRVAVAGDVGPFRHARDEEVLRNELARLAEVAPELEPVVLARDPRQLAGKVAAARLASLHGHFLDGLPRPPAIAALALGFRTLSLPRTFVDEVAAAERLVLVGVDPLDPALPLRELWPHLVTIRLARTRDLPVVIRTERLGPFRGVRGAIVRWFLRGVAVERRADAEPAPPEPRRVDREPTDAAARRR